MAKIIAICGKICCGKTYYANQIKEKEKAIILSCDELTKDLFDNDLGEKHDEMVLRIWNTISVANIQLRQNLYLQRVNWMQRQEIL